MLRSEFPRLSDPEEIYQEAWAELLELGRRGDEPVRNVRALLKKIASRRAIDAVRRRRPDSLDPLDGVLTLIADEQPSTDVLAERRIEAATMDLVIGALHPREAAVIKLRFHDGLSSKEIQERLDLTAKRLEKIVTSAYDNLLAELDPAVAGESSLRRQQRSLLLACEAGIASSRQRDRARDMLAADPTCRAMLGEMRRTLEGVAAVLPMPPVLVLAEDHDGRRLHAVLGWWEHLRGAGSRVVSSLTDRLPGESAAADGAAAGGSVVGAGAAAKVAVVCLAAGSTAALCGVSLHRHKPLPSARAALPHVVRAPDRATPIRHVVKAAAAPREPVAHAKTLRRTRPRRARSRVVAPSRVVVSRVVAPSGVVAPSSPQSKPAASPAPVGSTEFGPGSVGSAPAVAAPAAAPATGGGEFGP